MILHPAWKLLNFHLPIFTEVLGYNQSLKELQGEDVEEQEYQRGNESDDDEESYGVEGMT